MNNPLICMNINLRENEYLKMLDDDSAPENFLSDLDGNSEHSTSQLNQALEAIEDALSIQLKKC